MYKNLQLRRTANAGVLLELDGVKLLLDGVCGPSEPYLATPADLRQELLENPPDLMAVTHNHKDHFDPSFASAYFSRTSRPILGPASLQAAGLVSGPVQVGPVLVTPVPSRHIGKAGATTDHVAFVIRGSSCLWFLGDSAPVQWRSCPQPRPDVLLVPYAYATNQAGWKVVRELGAPDVVLLHLPDRDCDPAGLWPMVEQTTRDREGIRLWIPELGRIF